MGKRDIFMVVAAVLAAIVLVAGQFWGQSVEAGAWGLSFPAPGQSPQGPVSAEALKKYDAAYMGAGEEKVLYLTFDAGYENGYTEKILDTLNKHNAPAAFFLVGNYIEKNEDLVRRMVSEGHIVGNHTMHHPDMSKITDPEKFQAELTALEDLFRETTGKEMPKFYRPPQGCYSEENLKNAQALGYKTVFWSLAYADWDTSNQPTHQAAYDKLLPRVHNGAIILLHSTSATNAEILDDLLTKWASEGYRFESLDKVFS